MSITLALLHGERDISPLNNRGLTRTQMSKGTLTKRYTNADLLYRDGSIRPVLGIEFGRFIGSVLPFPFHWITIAGEREVKLILGDAVRRSIDDVKKQISEYLQTQNRFDEWLEEGEQKAHLISRIRASKSFEDLFKALHLKSESDGLDVLC